MFFIVEGFLDCYSRNQRKNLAKLEPGDFFGERSLLCATRRPYPIVAATFVTTFNLARDIFFETLMLFPEIEIEIINARTHAFMQFNSLVKKRIRELLRNEDLDPIERRRGGINPLKNKTTSNAKHILHKLLVGMEIPQKATTMLGATLANLDGGIINKEELENNRIFDMKKIELIIGSDTEPSGNSLK